jgi:hypothetical protein
VLYPDADETRTSEPGYDAGAYYGVAPTHRGNIAVYTPHLNDGFAPTLDVYSSFEEAERGGESTDILVMAATAISADYVQKLDIKQVLLQIERAGILYRGLGPLFYL